MHLLGHVQLVLTNHMAAFVHCIHYLQAGNLTSLFFHLFSFVSVSTRSWGRMWKTSQHTWPLHMLILRYCSDIAIVVLLCTVIVVLLFGIL